MHETQSPWARAWRRHDLLLVAPETWRAALLRSPWTAELPFVQGWAARGWPVILRRHAEEEDPRLVPVGLPLPPGAGRHRVALQLSADGILQAQRPPALRAAARVAIPAWQSTITALLDLGDRHHVEPSVVGSLLWQHVTGLPYLSQTSDLDLLWPFRGRPDILALLDGIMRVQQGSALRIDGEVILPDGAGVHWRELWSAAQAANGAGVLAKSMRGVRLLDDAVLPVPGRVS